MTRKEARKYVIVEWCEQQKCFHIDFLDKSLQRNINSFLEEWQAVYVPVAIVSSWDEADAFIADLQRERPNALIQWAERMPGLRDRIDHLRKDIADWPQAFDD